MFIVQVQLVLICVMFIILVIELNSLYRKYKMLENELIRLNLSIGSLRMSRDSHQENFQKVIDILQNQFEATVFIQDKIFTKKPLINKETKKAKSPRNDVKSKKV